MTYDGKLLARARTALDRIRTDNETEHQLRLAAAYAARPEIRRCDEEMRAQMTELVRITLAREADGCCARSAMRPIGWIRSSAAKNAATAAFTAAESAIA